MPPSSTQLPLCSTATRGLSLLPVCAIALAAVTLCATSAHAQSGDRAGASASEFPTPTSTQRFNPEAWDAFTSGDTERMFGTWGEQSLRLGFEYQSQASLWGYRIGESTFIPSLEWLSPLFGGESYTEIRGYLPADGGKYANQLWIIGGWRYHLTKHLDVDVGGNFVFANKRLGGPGLVAENGWRARGTFYLGLIGRHWLHPALYGIYDFELDQVQVAAGLRPELPLTDLGIDAPGFTLEGTFGASYVKGNRWFGSPNVTAPDYWSNEYVYWMTEVRLRYDFEGSLNGLSTHIGVSYTGRANGSSDMLHPTAPVDMGPRNQVSFNTGISYGF